MVLDAQAQLAYVPIVARQTAQMVQTYRAWTPEQWQRPTYCPGWKAADAVAHLATGGDFYAQVITAGRHGTPILPWGATDLAEFRAKRTAASQALIDAGPAGLVGGFEQSAATLQKVFESLQEADLSKVARHPRGLVPLGAWIGMRITELGIHDWDIRQFPGATASLSETVLPALLAVLPEMQAQFLGQRATDIDGVYALHAGNTAWGFTVQGQAITYHPEVPATADASLHTDAESMILLTMGRAEVAAKLQSSALTLTGNADSGRQLCATLFRPF